MRSVRKADMKKGKSRYIKSILCCTCTSHTSLRVISPESIFSQHRNILSRNIVAIKFVGQGFPIFLLEQCVAVLFIRQLLEFGVCNNEIFLLLRRSGNGKEEISKR